MGEQAGVAMTEISCQTLARGTEGVGGGESSYLAGLSSLGVSNITIRILPVVVLRDKYEVVWYVHGL